MPRAMKDSGIKWIGVIPAEWNVVNIRKFFSFGKGLPITKEDLRESGLPVISYGQIHSKSNSGTTITSELIRFVDDDYLQSNSQSLVKRGDFIFADTSEDLAGCGNCVYVDTDERIFAGYHTIILRNNTCSQMKYFAFLFQSDAWRKQIREQVTGVKLFSISQKILRATSVIIPPLEEQQRIADYLDGECARIDNVIEKTRASIVEYKKLKQAIITRAVTKGIRPNRTLKHSGIEWLGDIPADWKVLSFTKSICSIVDYRGKTPEKQDEGTLLVTARNIKDGKIDYDCSREFVRTEDFDEIMHRGKIEIGDVLFTTEAPLGSVANADCTDFALAQRIIKFRGFPDVLDNYYLKYWIMSDVFQQNLTTFSTGSTAKGIKASKLSMLKQILPPLEEQKEIAAYLDGKTAAIDSLIEKKGRLVTELERLKKSLIFEYVTGKKEALEKA